jgi:tripartite-type tricarboxylate transporter receptor subunit TctC
VKKLNEVLVSIVAMPEIQRQMLEGGSDPSSGTPEKFQQMIVDDLQKYTRLVTDLNLKAD